MTTRPEHFPTGTAGLPEAGRSQSVELADGDHLELRIAPVAKRFVDSTVRMLAYNGSIPGPTLRVRQGSRLSVTAINEGDLETTVHWHGLRLDNRFDGTTLTQPAVPVGGRFTYQLEFPDPGVYWYHPHIREDYGQEMGLYGNIVVVPAEPDYWPAVHRELTLVLDDVLLEDGRLAPFSRAHATHVAMGRFGNVLLVNGEQAPSLAARPGEVVRFYLTNTANARVFHLGMDGARMKLVGGDSGRCERETFVERVLLAPSERAVVDVRFDRTGPVALEHHTPGRRVALATIVVSGEPAEPSLVSKYADLRTPAEWAAERARIARHVDAPPDKTLALVAEMDMGAAEAPPGAKAAYACPMHPEVRSGSPDRCPKCGMRLVPAHLVDGAHGEPRHAPAPASHDAPHHEHTHSAHGGHHAPAPDGPEQPRVPGGIEWEDDMAEVNRSTSPANTRWKLVDRATGASGMAIDWRFRVGQRIKLRLVNEMDSDHPMHHPFHVHGAGRFLVLARDGAVEPNLVWKDSVLVPTGQTVDLLLDVTNPGVWMAHCHIAEHHESGMMLRFTVEP